MNKKTKAVIIMVIFTLLTLADCYLTWAQTPDLSMEANPLVSVFGLGWFSLILSNIITLGAFYLLTYFAFVKYTTPIVVVESKENLAKKVFAVNGKASTIAMLGFAMAYSLIVSRAIVVAEWVTIHFGLNKQWMYWVRDTIAFSRPDLIVAVVLTIVLSIVWLIKEEKDKMKLAVVLPAEKIELEGSGEIVEV